MNKLKIIFITTGELFYYDISAAVQVQENSLHRKTFAQEKSFKYHMLLLFILSATDKPFKTVSYVQYIFRK